MTHLNIVQRLLDTARMRTQYPEWLCDELEAAAAEIARLTVLLAACERRNSTNPEQISNVG